MKQQRGRPFAPRPRRRRGPDLMEVLSALGGIGLFVIALMLAHASLTVPQ